MYRKIINEIQQEKSLFKPKYNNNLSDTEGLNKAYTNGKGYYLDNNKLYVAGTFGKSNIISNINDILSDITIPFGLSSFSESIEILAIYLMKTIILVKLFHIHWVVVRVLNI